MSRNRVYVHAINELTRTGRLTSDEVFTDIRVEAIGQQFLAILCKYTGIFHDPTVVANMFAIFHRLALLKPLTPLTGEDSEWVRVHNKPFLTNTRCPSVFRTDAGDAYDGESEYHIHYAFNDEGWRYSYEKKIDTPITFPYYPPTERRLVPCTDECGESAIKDL